MGWQEMGRNVDSWRWQLLIPAFCHRVGKWFADYNSVAIKPEWTPPARTMVDPAREVPPIRDAVRSCLMSPQEAMREQGYDPQRLMQEWQQFTEMADKLGLVLDIDPRHDKAAKQQTTEATDETD